MRILFLALMLILAASSASAAVYQQGIVYVIYDETGTAAPADKSDVNSNGVPDMVENIATQLNATRELFKDVFNFPDPLESARYKKATSIEVDIGEKAIMKHNGLAYVGVRKKSKHDPNERAIHIKVANTVDPRKNSTPAHEYFHLIQSGTTYFGNKWYIEGMARWSQDAVSKIKKYPDGENISSTLDSPASKAQIFKEKYKVAKLLWYPLAVAANDKQKIPDRLIKKYKYADGSEVFHDNIIYGPNVMREVMLLMKSRENLAEQKFGDKKIWRRKGRRADSNNEIILDCVREVYNSKK